MLVKKVSLKLLSSNVTSVDVTRAKAQEAFTVAVHCESNANIGRIESMPQMETDITGENVSSQKGTTRQSGKN